MSMLSRNFQHKFVDVRFMGFVYIYALFFYRETQDLNVIDFSEDTYFHFIHKFGLVEGYLHQLPSGIKGAKITRHQNGL